MNTKNLELLLKQILALHQRKRKEFKEKWGRAIPFLETVLGACSKSSLRIPDILFKRCLSS